MWPKIKSSDCCCPEPIELRKLKHKLASVACNCRSCKKSKSSTTTFLLTQKDQQVQVEESQKSMFHQYTQASPHDITKAHDEFMNTITKDVLCPSCFVTMNLLRGGILRVLKDEEVETNRQMFSSEKSTERNVKTTNKSTSYCDNTMKYSNMNMCDLLSESSSYVSMTMSTQDKQHQVKFVESEKDLPKVDPCMCLENFIDSIRPPLADFLF